MTKNEWNFTFSKIMSWYPAWKPDKLVSASWFEEIGKFPQDYVLMGVKRLAKNTLSAFPPQIFQISALLHSYDPGAKKIAAAEEWQKVKKIAAAGAPEKKKSELSERTLRVVNSIGGFREIGLKSDRELVFVERRFLGLYEEVNDQHELKALTPSKELRKLTQKVGRKI